MITKRSIRRYIDRAVRRAVLSILDADRYTKSQLEEMGGFGKFTGFEERGPDKSLVKKGEQRKGQGRVQLSQREMQELASLEGAFKQIESSCNKLKKEVDDFTRRVSSGYETSDHAKTILARFNGEFKIMNNRNNMLYDKLKKYGDLRYPIWGQQNSLLPQKADAAARSAQSAISELGLSIQNLRVTI